jgi:HK97 family phage major capsid protein
MTMPNPPVVGRTDAVIIPQAAAEALISGTVRQSAALSCFTRVPTGTKDSVVPVLSRDIEAGWLSSDTGLKRVDAPKWEGEHLVAEELAVLVPIPNAVIADQTFNITAAMTPLFTRAMARGVDRAAIFGVNKPAGWPSPSLIEAATAAGNTVEAGADPVEDLMAAAEQPSAQGYIVNRAVVRPGWQFAAARVRAHDLVANPAGADEPFPLIVAGLPIYLDPPAWRTAQAHAFVIDSSCCLIGIRQDLTVTVHPDGVITDADGKVLFSAMQQDSTIYRAVMRVGFLLAAPPTDAGLPADERAPVAAVVPPAGARAAGTQAAAHRKA